MKSDFTLRSNRLQEWYGNRLKTWLKYWKYLIWLNQKGRLQIKYKNIPKVTVDKTEIVGHRSSYRNGLTNGLRAVECTGGLIKVTYLNNDGHYIDKLLAVQYYN